MALFGWAGAVLNVAIESIAVGAKSFYVELLELRKIFEPQDELGLLELGSRNSPVSGWLPYLNQLRSTSAGSGSTDTDFEPT